MMQQQRLQNDKTTTIVWNANKTFTGWADPDLSDRVRGCIIVCINQN
jgi:hypothetical protein